MYNILFHVSGIAILEMCFYFFYIGPMETKLFEKVIDKLGSELYVVIEKNMLTLEDTSYVNTFIPTYIPTISRRLFSLPHKMIDNNLRDLAESDTITIKNILTEFMDINLFL